MFECAWLHGKRGWRPVTSSAAVGLQRPRFVRRVGYEVDFGTVLGEMLEEAPVQMIHREGDDSVALQRLCWSRDCGVPAFDRESVARLILCHPVFEEYRDQGGAFLQKLVETIKDDFDQSAVYRRLWDHASRELVRAVVKERLRKKLLTSSSRERRVWFEDDDDVLRRYALGAGSAGVASDWWVGPWSVEARRDCATGKYVPASGGRDSWGEDDFEPACLADVKTHVILRLCSDGRARFAVPYGQLVAASLKEDVFDWETHQTLEAIEKSAEVA